MPEKIADGIDSPSERSKVRAIELFGPLFPTPDVSGVFNWASGLILTSHPHELLKHEADEVANFKDFALTLTHELTHLGQAATCGSLFRWQSALLEHVVLLLEETIGRDGIDEDVIETGLDSLVRFPHDHARHAARIEAICAHVAMLEIQPDDTGISTRMIMEGHASFVEYAVHYHGGTFAEWLHHEKTAYTYRHTYDVARFILGEEFAAEVFPAASLIALCSQNPPLAYVEVLETIARTPRTATAKDIVVAALASIDETVQSPAVAADELGSRAHFFLAPRVGAISEDLRQDWFADPAAAIERLMTPLDPITVFRPNAEQGFPIMQPFAKGEIDRQWVQAGSLFDAFLDQALRLGGNAPTDAPEPDAWLASIAPKHLVHVFEANTNWIERADEIADRLEKFDGTALVGRCSLLFVTNDDQTKDVKIPAVREAVAALRDRAPWLGLYLDLSRVEPMPMIVLWIGCLLPTHLVNDDGTFDLLQPEALRIIVELVNDLTARAETVGITPGPQLRNLALSLPEGFGEVLADLVGLPD